MNVFEMEKEFNDLVKRGQELIEKLKQENSDDTMIGKIGWFYDISPNEKVRCDVLTRIRKGETYPYISSSDDYWVFFTPLTPEDVEKYTGYKVEE